ncbi:MAG: acylphosphatase [Proteobacteria bacterium]|nr:acylphosphatase [Pseudomonadota bacterium]
MEKQVRIVVKGRVQGVFFRDYTRKKASSLGLKGTVRNMPDGSVEIRVQGDIKMIEELKEWCWRGSPSSQVDDVIVRDLQEEQEMPPFKVAY